MKIAYFCSAYPAVSHTFILREVEALRRRGVLVTTFTIKRTAVDQLLSDADRLAARTTVSIRPIRLGRFLAAHLKLGLRAPHTYLSILRNALALAPPGLRGRLWQLFYFAEAVQLWDECERRGIRHVHVHLANAAADVAMIATKIGSALDAQRPWTWSFTMHGPTEFYDLRHFRLAEKVRSASFVVCISDFARSQLMGLSDPDTWDRLHVIHVGIPIERFTRDGGAGATNGTIMLSNGATTPSQPPPTVLYIGRLVPEKGQAVLLEGVAELVSRGHDVRLELAGEGSLRPDLERLAKSLGIANHVSFLGAVGQDELPELYGRAAIFCLPSFAEGVPVVLMEAMAMGLPAVSTRIAGIPELIEDGRSGVLVAPGRVDELADSLARLLEDPGLRHDLGAGGREKVLHEFDAELSAEKLADLFASECPPS